MTCGNGTRSREQECTDNCTADSYRREEEPCAVRDCPCKLQSTDLQCQSPPAIYQITLDNGSGSRYLMHCLHLLQLGGSGAAALDPTLARSEAGDANPDRAARDHPLNWTVSHLPAEDQALTVFPLSHLSGMSEWCHTFARSE